MMGVDSGGVKGVVDGDRWVKRDRVVSGDWVWGVMEDFVGDDDDGEVIDNEDKGN